MQSKDKCLHKLSLCKLISQTFCVCFVRPKKTQQLIFSVFNDTNYFSFIKNIVCLNMQDNVFYHIVLILCTYYLSVKNSFKIIVKVYLCLGENFCPKFLNVENAQYIKQEMQKYAFFYVSQKRITMCYGCIKRFSYFLY